MRTCSTRVAGSTNYRVHSADCTVAQGVVTPTSLRYLKRCWRATYYPEGRYTPNNIRLNFMLQNDFPYSSLDDTICDEMSA